MKSRSVLIRSIRAQEASGTTGPKGMCGTVDDCPSVQIVIVPEGKKERDTKMTTKELSHKRNDRVDKTLAHEQDQTEGKRDG